LLYLHLDTKWKQEGITIAGGNGKGNQLNQLSSLFGICIDDDQTIYIADCGNHRIVEWTCNAKNGQIVAGGNGKGNKTNQLNEPTDVIIDKEKNSLIICDYYNRRIIRWSREKNTKNGEIIINDIDCYGLAMDKNGSLYVSDYKKDEVRRWKIGDQNGTIVAGGNGEGNHLNQLNSPSYIFVDEDYSLYVSDSLNHRVMKWLKDAKEGIVVAGGNGQGERLTQLLAPQGVIVNHLGQIYVADWDNHRVMRWCKGAKEGAIFVGGNGVGRHSTQFYHPSGLSFDLEGNLYVADCDNNRLQKFEIN
jgi:sugar lactone lactonase YvrE